MTPEIMINCKDQTHNAPDFDLLFDFDAFSKSDEMEVLTPESTSTSFSTHEPNSLHIPTEILIPTYFNSGSISPMACSPSQEDFRIEYEHASGNGSTRTSSTALSGVPNSDDALGLSNPFPGPNVVQSPRLCIEQTSFQALGQNNSFQPSTQTQLSVFSSGQFYPESLITHQPPAAEPWSHLDMPLYDVNQHRDGAIYYTNCRPQAPEQYQNQLFLALTDLSPTVQMQSAPFFDERSTQTSHQTHNARITSIQQPAFVGPFVERPFEQTINPQSITDFNFSDNERFSHESRQVDYQHSNTHLGHNINDNVITHPYMDNSLNQILETSFYLPSSGSPCQSPTDSFKGHSREGVSPSNSFSSSAQSHEGHRTAGGGRQVGSKLNEESKGNAVKLRKIGSCWRCSLRRDSCGEGSPCPRCLDKSVSGTNLRGIECTRVKLRDLGFIPVPLSTIYGHKRVTEFRSSHFNGRTGRWYIIPLSVGRDLDTFECELHEFLPKDGEPQSCVNYHTSPLGYGMIPERKLSANLELRSLSKSDMPQYSAYLDRLLESSLTGKPNFAHACYAGENTSFAERLLILLIEAYQQLDPQGPKKSALRDCLKLIISTYIVSRNITFDESTRTVPPNIQSSRMANKQLKYFFFSIMASQLQGTLNEMQQQLRHSCNIGQVTSLVYSVLCLAMSLDILLRYIYITADHMKNQESSSWGCSGDDVIQKAESFGLNIESGFDFITRIFQEKFKRTNPFDNPYADSWIGKLKPVEIVMFRRIDHLVRDNYDYLKVRQSTKLSISNISSFTSRLVSKFLLAVRPFT